LAKETPAGLTVVEACTAAGVPPSAVFLCRARAKLPPTERRQRPSPARKLTQDEEQVVLDLLHSERFRDQTPTVMYYTLLDEGVLVGSISTFYRILRRHGEVKERRALARHPKRETPRLSAARPNAVWCWDISKIKGPKWFGSYNLYAVIDMFSRKIIAWEIHPEERASIFVELLCGAVAREGIEPDQLILHADNGSPMKAEMTKQALLRLGIDDSHSRPHVSNDNAYIESFFKTLKYDPQYPMTDGVLSLNHAREHLIRFFAWHNTGHYHKGIGFMHPEVVHEGRQQAVRDARQQVLDAAYAAHPERYGRRPVPPKLPTTAYINQVRTTA
jgi:transposase InsO family protein